MAALTFTGKIDSSGRITGPDAERMRPELRDHFAGEFVKITVTGLAEYSENYRAKYFASIIPHVIRAMVGAGYNLDPHDPSDQAATHDLMKAYFITPPPGKEPSTSGFSPEEWRRYLRDIEEWLFDFFTYSISENEPQ